MIVEIIVGAVITALFALIAYFLNRLITQYDGFQDETRRAFEVSGRKTRRIELSLAEVQRQVQEGSLDEATKRKITSLTTSLMEVKEELRMIRPALEKSEENYGQIILVGDALKAQEKKLKGLYDVLKALTENTSGQQ